jgi:glycosyltransferase involved in cell wall biosynthesis
MNSNKTGQSSRRIMIDLSAGVHGRAGLGRYAVDLLNALVALDAENGYSIFYNSPEDARVPAPFAHLPRQTVALGDKPWRFQTLIAHFLRRPQDSTIGAADIFHGTDNLLPYLRSCRTVFTLHDLIFRLYPATHTRLNRWFLTLMMPFFLRRADHVIADSAASAQDAMRLYNLDPQRTTVIHAGVNPSFRPVTDGQAHERVRAQYGLPQRFVLSVGTIEPRKNLSTLLRAFAMLPTATATDHDTKLVIVGKKGWLYQQTLDLVDALDLTGRVHFTGFVTDDDLPVVYSMSDLFVYPSLYEGFGLPVLEAMACGAPVITSNVSSLPEVAGEDAILVDPLDVDGLKAALLHLLQNEALRLSLRERGIVRAARFTWQHTAQKTLDLYSQLTL